MKRIGKLFIWILCFVLISSWSVFAANDDAAAIITENHTEQESYADEILEEGTTPDNIFESEQGDVELGDNSDEEDGDSSVENPDDELLSPEENTDPGETDPSEDGLPGEDAEEQGTENEDLLETQENPFETDDTKDDAVELKETEDKEKTEAAMAAAPLISISVSGSTYTFTVKNIPDIDKVSSVQFAIWSQDGNQDDLKWYVASLNKTNATASLTETLSYHTDMGLYYVHAYAYDTSGNANFLQGSSFDRNASGKTSVASYKIGTNRKVGRFTLNASGIYTPKGIKLVKAAVWCKDNKSDLVWYTLNNDGFGGYSVTGDISNHGNHRGTYKTKLYVVNKKGKSKLLAEKTFKMVSGCSAIDISTSDMVNYKVKVNKIVVPGGIQKVQFAIWSEAGNQDDIVWYTASGRNGGKYTLSFNSKELKRSGKHFLAVYATTSAGNTLYMRTASFTILPQLKYTLTKSSVNSADGRFMLTTKIKSSPVKVKTIKYEVWCSPDKSDVYWYRVSNSSGKTFKAQVNTANHYGHTGTYQVNVVAVFSNGLEGTIASTTQDFTPQSYLQIPQSNGTSVRRIYYVNTSVSTVSFKVWTTRGGQGDGKTYKAKKTKSGKFYADVRMKDFTFDGKYRIEVYSGSTLLDAGSFIMLDYLEEGYKMALDDSIGYSQINRCLNPDVDCSSFVHYALLNTGYNIPDGWPLTTYWEEDALRGAGFSMVAYTNISDLQPGDILLRDGHTEIYAGHGTTVGAHGDENNDIYGKKPGDQTGHEVCIAPLVENWKYVFRLITYQT